MNVLVADDHELLRDTLAAFLEHEGFRVFTAADYTAATAAIRQNGPFDLVLLDYHMPGMDGVASLVRAVELNTPNPVALMSGTTDRRVANEALTAGAAGFLPKTMPAKSLVHAVRFMLAGERYAPIAFMTNEQGSPAHHLSQKLSPRETEVLDGLCRGLANKEIARELGLAEVTIKLHVRTLCRKLDAKNRTHAAMIAKEARVL